MTNKVFNFLEAFFAWWYDLYFRGGDIFPWLTLGYSQNKRKDWSRIGREVGREGRNGCLKTWKGKWQSFYCDDIAQIKKKTESVVFQKVKSLM